MSDLTRRGFLTAMGGTVGAVWLAGDPAQWRAAGEYAARAATMTPPPPFQVLTPEQAADLDAIAAQVIPTDDTPGAREARTVYFIDHAFATFAKDSHEPFVKAWNGFRERAGKAYPGAKSFAALTSAQQQAFLTALEKQKDDFFGMAREMTVAGMFANPEYGGNYQKIGWKLIGFEDRFSWAPPFGWYDRNVG
jgi:gluconate 2-dehydrogenase gamma chain